MLSQGKAWGVTWVDWFSEQEATASPDVKGPSRMSGSVV